MNTPLIIWCCIAALVLLILTIRVSSDLSHKNTANRPKKRHRLIEIGPEWEELFIPGDHIIKNDNEYDYNEPD